jgi:hypothetical protein
MNRIAILPNDFEGVAHCGYRRIKKGINCGRFFTPTRQSLLP